MSRKTCWRCGTSYDGLSCPVCAVAKSVDRQTDALEKIHEEESRERKEMARSIVEEERATREAMSETTFQMEMALADAAEKQKKTVSEAWKHQAQAKTDRAYELYKLNFCKTRDERAKFDLSR